MKYALLCFSLATTSAFAQLPSRSDCRARIALVNSSITHINDRFKVGEVTHTDVAKMEFKLVTIQLECAEIVRGNLTTAGSYCSQANVDRVNMIKFGTEEEAKVGQRTDLEVDEAAAVKLAFDQVCAP